MHDTKTMSSGIPTIIWDHPLPGDQKWDRNHEPWNPSHYMRSLTSWRAGMGQEPWTLESQLSHQITHFLESRNATETMSLGMPAITSDHSQTGEQEWDRNHEPWNPSYHIRSLTNWRAGMGQKPWALESQLSHEITHSLESRNGTETMSLGMPTITLDHSQTGEQEWDRKHEPWNANYHIRSLTDWRAGMGQKAWALECQLSHQITHKLESRNGTESMSLGMPTITSDHSLPGEQKWDRNHEPWNASYHIRSLTSWRAGMGQKAWALESQLSHQITHFLKSRNGTEIISLGIPAITWHHLLSEEQEWNRNHEPWNPSYHIKSLTDWRVGMGQKPWALKSQLSNEITYSLMSRNGTETMSLGVPAITWDH